MDSYRIQLPASITVSIAAESAEAALKVAEELRDDLIDGCDFPLPDEPSDWTDPPEGEPYDGRVYFDEDGKPEVVNIESLGKEDEDEDEEEESDATPQSATD